MNTKPRVLIIEDEMDLAMEMAELFDLWGYPVRTAFDGHTGLKMAKLFIPDVVIMDIGLPGINGFVLTRALRDDPVFKNPLIIAASGYGSEGYRRTALDSGIDHYFVKPANMDAIRNVIEEDLS